MMIKGIGKAVFLFCLGLLVGSCGSMSLSPNYKTPSHIHKVVAKETVYSISRTYHVPVRSIIDANKIKPPYTLKIGENLYIPSQKAHKVKQGDTLYSLSKRYDVELAALARTNNLKAPYALNVGQMLVMPNEADQTDTQWGTAPADTTTAIAEASVTKSTPGIKRGPAKPLPKTPVRTGQFGWSVKGKIVSNYGPSGNGKHNDGINIAAAKGTSIKAAENGVVAYAGNELKGFGNLLLIKHADGWVTAYAHADSISVARGQTVKKGDVIGKVGNTGNVKNPQLHFEIRKGTKAVDPRPYLRN